MAMGKILEIRRPKDGPARRGANQDAGLVGWGAKPYAILKAEMQRPVSRKVVKLYVVCFYPVLQP